MRASKDKRADPLATFDQAEALQLPVCLEHRIGIDRHFGHDLLHGRQLVSGSQVAHAQGLFHLLDDLKIRRDARAGVERERDRLFKEFPSHLENYEAHDLLCQATRRSPTNSPGAQTRPRLVAPSPSGTLSGDDARMIVPRRKGRHVRERGGL